MWRMMRGRDSLVIDNQIVGWVEPSHNKRSTEIRVGNMLYDMARGTSRSGREELDVYNARGTIVGRAYTKSEAERMLVGRKR